MNRIRFTRVMSVIALLCLSLGAEAQLLKTSGKKIVDDKNNEVLLRGMGLGGWMVQEGYMLETDGPQYNIKAKINDLMGESNTTEFYNAWLANHCTRKDIDSMASWGFNSVRLPMHYNLYTLPVEQEPVDGVNTWLEKGFALTDSLVKWCKANKMYVILDLHAAPGGQGHDANISDYDASKPSLWESEKNKAKTVELWKKLAQRYVDEPWVGGYDLINEPNWNFTAGANQNGCSETATSNQPLWDLYKSITTAIRSVDKNHIIFVEGNCWANNHAGFSKFDNNLVVSFHKYWSNNDVGTIQGYLTIRDNNSVPLWLGEAGENSNQWFTDAIQLCENNSIGWSWWPLKKVNSVVGPLTVTKNTDYATLTAYWADKSKPKPTSSFTKNALMQLVENHKIQNCTYHKDVIDAMFRQINNTATIPFANVKVPGVIHLTDYDLGSNNFAYSDKVVGNYQVSTQVTTPWNNGYAYRNDGVDLEATQDKDPKSNGFDVGWTEDGEWMQYTVNVDSTAAYNIAIRYAALSVGSKLHLSVNGGSVTTPLSLPATGGYQTWGNATFSDVVLSKGTQRIRLHIDKAGANLGFLNFSLSKKSSEVVFNAVSAETYQQTETIIASFNKSFDGSVINKSGFSCKVNGVSATIKSVAVLTSNKNQLSFTLDQKITDIDQISITYTGADAKSLDGTLLTSFSDLPVTNNLPKHAAIPGTIQAESFVFNNGLSVEACTDTDGGFDMGYSNVGDYLDFDVRVLKTATYTVEVRASSGGSAGVLDIQQIDENNSVINTISIAMPVTGGWQTWQSVKKDIQLTAGLSKLRVKVKTPEYNLNWFKFSEAVISGVKGRSQGNLYLYPNPAKSSLTIQIPEDALAKKKTVNIISLDGALVKSVEFNNEQSMQNLSLSEFMTGIYIVELQSVKGIWRNKLIIE